MKDLLKEKELQIIQAIKEKEEKKHPHIRLGTVSFLIVESKTNFPLCFTMDSNESGVEVINCAAESSSFPTTESGAIIFHCGNSNSDFNAVERKIARKIIQTPYLDFGDFSELSVSVFGVNKEESIFLSAFIASIIFEIDIKRVFAKMENLPPEIEDGTFYLFDYLKKKF